MLVFVRYLIPLLAALCFCQETSDPWLKTEILERAALAEGVHFSKAPMVFSVAFTVLEKGKHILHAIDAGPGSKPEGIELLKKGLAGVPKDADIVIYCGCCPMVKCPNIRPAYRTLKELGYSHVRVLNIPTNMHTDWFSKDYPSEAGSSTSPAS